MSLYFVVSGFNVLLDIDAKLLRIGLSANDLDGRLAFILIYCSLMVGVGVAISLLFYLSKTWLYSAILAVTIITSFIVFRLIAGLMVGELSQLQLSFIAVEILEVALGLFLIIKSGRCEAQAVLKD